LPDALSSASAQRGVYMKPPSIPRSPKQTESGRSPSGPLLGQMATPLPVPGEIGAVATRAIKLTAAPGAWEGPAQLATMLGDFDDRRFATLCEDLGVDLGMLAGEDLAAQKISLIAMFVKRNGLDELESAIKRTQSIQELQGSLPEPTGGTVILFLSYSHKDD